MADGDYEEVDVLLCLLVAQIARHQRQADGGDVDPEWVSMAAVEALCQRIGHLGAAAIERGWHTAASQRGLLEVRETPGGPKVRLNPPVAASVGLDLARPKPVEHRLRRLLRLLRGSG